MSDQEKKGKTEFNTDLPIHREVATPMHYKISHQDLIDACRAEPVKHYGVLSHLNQEDGFAERAPRTMPDKSVGESEMRSGDLLADDEGMFLPLSAVSKNSDGGLSIDLNVVAARNTKEKK